MPAVPVYYLAVAFFTLVLGPLFPPTKLRACIGTIINGTLLWHVRILLANSPTDIPHVLDYAVHGILVWFMLRWVDSFVIHTPEKDFHRIKNVPIDGKSITVIERVPIEFWAKLEWSLDFAISVRGVGWNYEIKHLPDGVPEGYSKIRFVISQIIFCFISHIIMEYLYIVLATTPYMSSIARPDFPSDSLITQALVAWIIVISSYFNFSSVHSMCAIFFTLIGYTAPSSWRPLFGKIIDDQNVRSRWGQGWHQIMRRNILEPGKWICQQLGFKKNSFGYRYGQLYTGFLISAFAHSRPISSTTTYHLAEYKFMMAQALFITAEDFIRTQYHKMGFKRSVFARIFGYTTTFIWFSLTLPICAYGTATDGLLATQPDPASHILRMLPCRDCDANTGKLIVIRGLQCLALTTFLHDLRRLIG